MFCEKCGQKLPEKVLFCVNCGEKIPERQAAKNIASEAPEPMAEADNQIQWEAPKPSENKIPQSVPAKPKKPMSVFSKIILAECILVIALGIFFGMKVKEYVSPEYVAEQYFAAVMSGDSQRAYPLVEVENDSFINEQQFQKVVENISQQRVSNFKVEKEPGSEDDFTCHMNIAYRLKEDTGDYTMSLTLEKSEKKKWLFFDDWKVNVGNYIVKDVSIETMQGAKVTVAGQELSKEQISQEKNEMGNVVYTIPRMFEGTYEAVITNDMYEDIAFEMDVYDEDDCYFEEDEGTLKKEIVESVMDNAKTDFKTLWENAGEKKNFSEIKLKSELTGSSDVAMEYEQTVNKFADKNKEGMKNLNFGEFKVNAYQDEDDYDEDVPCILVQFVSDLDYISVTSDWWSGELEEEEDSMEGYTAILRYVYQDNEWKLNNMDMGIY